MIAANCVIPRIDFSNLLYSYNDKRYRRLQNYLNVQSKYSNMQPLILPFLIAIGLLLLAFGFSKRKKQPKKNKV